MAFIVQKQIWKRSNQVPGFTQGLSGMGRRHRSSEASTDELDHALYVGLSSTDFQHGCDRDAVMESLCEFLQG